MFFAMSSADAGRMSRREQSGYLWHDDEWMNDRQHLIPKVSPVNLFAADTTVFGSQLVDQIQRMGYTHLCLTQPAVTANADECLLMELIDSCHSAKIGVILPWSPPFCADELDEQQHCSRLMEDACSLLTVYHADGLFLPSPDDFLLYDDSPRCAEAKRNLYGGRENLSGFAFLHGLSETIARDFPGVMMIAGECSGFPMMTGSTWLGGLGFHLKWNADWLDSTVSYLRTDAMYRKWRHPLLLSSLLPDSTEHRLFPLRLHETQQSLLELLPGDEWQKFAGLRALHGYTMALPGKKLFSAGSMTIPEVNEGETTNRCEALQQCLAALNQLYREYPALYAADHSPDSFQWVGPWDCDNSVIAFLRCAPGEDAILCVVNFRSIFHPIYRVGLPHPGTLTEVFNTDKAQWGGSDQYNGWEPAVEAGNYNSFPYWADLCVPPLGCVYFRYHMHPSKTVRKNRFGTLPVSLRRKKGGVHAT
ncbi:MAG: hypothetical protein E7319_09775 [Clostridiales bacterium]|nr:hypothetical protein [Clostridiales bacterium]